MLTTSLLFHLLNVDQFMQAVFLDDPNVAILDVDFNDTHMVFILRESQTLKLCKVTLPLPNHEVNLNSKCYIFSV